MSRASKKSGGDVLRAVKPDELADLYRDAMAEGCELTLSAKTHVVVILPDGRHYHGPQTSGDIRSVLNVRSQLRRFYGLALRSSRHSKKKGSR